MIFKLCRISTALIFTENEPFHRFIFDNPLIIRFLVRTPEAETVILDLIAYVF